MSLEHDEGTELLAVVQAGLSRFVLNMHLNLYLVAHISPLQRQEAPRLQLEEVSAVCLNLMKRVVMCLM